MPLGKCITLYLMDGDAEGRWSAALSNWNGQAYKIPRKDLVLCESITELQAPGVYFLFGKYTDTAETFVYVGEADNAFKRILQPHTFENETVHWLDAVIFVTPDSTLDKGKVKYLENRFYVIAKEAGSYKVVNGNTPTQSPLAIQTKDMLEEFILKAKLVMPVLGYKVFEKHHGTVFEPAQQIEAVPHIGCGINDILYCAKRNSTGGTGIGRFIAKNEFKVLKGSYITPKLSDSALKCTREDRVNYSHFIGTDDILQQDITFSAPTRAADFVLGQHVNGMKAWKNETGIELKRLLSTQE